MTVSHVNALRETVSVVKPLLQFPDMCGCTFFDPDRSSLDAASIDSI
jgi:hypothetical protein